MRTQDQLLGSRARVRDRYALLPLEGIPYSKLPEWPGALVRVFAAPVLGANFAEYRIDLEQGYGGSHEADHEIEHFLFFLNGGGSLIVDETEHRMRAGGFALIPPTSSYRVTADEPTALLLLRKRYEPAPGIELFEPLVGNEEHVGGEVYMGDPGALLQKLVPEELTYDLSVNIFTFQVGHSLPVTETHVMEHGLYVLGGKGLYYLDDTWMEVEATDFIWMGAFCPQSYYATGLEPTRYIYHKDVNREIEL
jgi:(S)-ureidoglycine aminohydrolase